MYIHISDASMLLNLQDFLRQSECVAVQRRSSELEVFVPGASDDQGRREVSVYLATWQARNPGIDAYVVDADPAAAS